MLRIHRNNAERASSELAADGSYVTQVEMGSSNIVCQLLCNDNLVTNLQFFFSSMFAEMLYRIYISLTHL